MIIGIDAHAAESDGSGNCTYIRNLLSGLKDIDSKNKYILYVTDTKHPYYRIFASRKNFVLKKLSVKSPLLRIPLFLAARSYLDSLDILHVQYNSPPFHKGKLIVTIHDLGFLHYPAYFARLQVLRLKVLTKLSVRKAAKIITGSNYSKNDIIKTYKLSPQKVTLIPYGISPNFQPGLDEGKKEKALKKYQIKSPYFLSVGRLNPRKNLVSLVKAYYKAKKQLDLPQSLVIAGKKDFNGSKIMQSIRSLEGSDDIVFTGFSADEDLPYLYAGADFFIYPSIFEGVGLPVLEAMKSGVPVIASNTSSLAEVVGEAGITVDPLIEEEIVLAISKMVGNKKLRDANIQKGLVRAKEYVPKIMAQQTLKIYEEVPS